MRNRPGIDFEKILKVGLLSTAIFITYLMFDFENEKDPGRKIEKGIGFVAAIFLIAYAFQRLYFTSVHKDLHKILSSYDAKIRRDAGIPFGNRGFSDTQLQMMQKLLRLFIPDLEIKYAKDKYNRDFLKLDAPRMPRKTDTARMKALLLERKNEIVNFLSTFENFQQELNRKILQKSGNTRFRWEADFFEDNEGQIQPCFRPSEPLTNETIENIKHASKRIKGNHVELVNDPEGNPVIIADNYEKLRISIPRTPATETVFPGLFNYPSRTIAPAETKREQKLAEPLPDDLYVRTQPKEKTRGQGWAQQRAREEEIKQERAALGLVMFVRHGDITYFYPYPPDLPRLRELGLLDSEMEEKEIVNREIRELIPMRYKHANLPGFCFFTPELAEIQGETTMKKDIIGARQGKMGEQGCRLAPASGEDVPDKYKIKIKNFAKEIEKPGQLRPLAEEVQRENIRVLNNPDNEGFNVFVFDALHEKDRGMRLDPDAGKPQSSLRR